MKRLSTSAALGLLPHRSYDRAQLVLAAGRRGQGKTTLVRGYLEHCEPRVLCLDPFDDFRGVRLSRSVESSLAEMDDGGARGPVRRRLRPPITGESLDYADHLFRSIIGGSDGAPPLRNALLVLDEMSLWSGSKETTALRTLVLQGRRLGIRMMVACQRIALVPGVLLSECTELVVYRMSRPRDLDVLADWAEDEDGEEIAITARKLQTGECLLLTL